MTRQLKSHLGGRWVAGEGEHAPLRNPTTEEVLAETSTKGIDFRAALEHARSKGGPVLREERLMTPVFSRGPTDSAGTINPCDQ